MMKRVGSIVAVVFFCTGILAFGMNFQDVAPGDWFSENIEVLVDVGIINGYGDGRFGPDEIMQEDQFIKTMVVALGYDLENGKDYWAQTYIDQAIEIGILEESNQIDYNQAITRAKMSEISVKVIESLEGKKTYKYDAIDNDLLLNKISDRSEITDKTMETFISQAYELGVITGYPDGSFQPIEGLKRSEACTVIRRVIDASQRQQFVASELDIRGQELYKSYGFMPFESGRENDESVYTQMELEEGNNRFTFESGLIMQTENIESGHWSIRFTPFVHPDYPHGGNKEVQYYQVEYLLEKIFDVDKEIVVEVLDVIMEKQTVNDFSSSREFQLSGGRILRVSSSEVGDNFVYISGLNFN